MTGTGHMKSQLSCIVLLLCLISNQVFAYEEQGDSARKGLIISDLGQIDDQSEDDSQIDEESSQMNLSIPLQVAQPSTDNEPEITYIEILEINPALNDTKLKHCNETALAHTQQNAFDKNIVPLLFDKKSGVSLQKTSFFSGCFQVCAKIAISISEFRLTGICGGMSTLLFSYQTYDQMTHDPVKFLFMTGINIIKDAARIMYPEQDLKGIRSIAKVAIHADRVAVKYKGKASEISIQKTSYEQLLDHFQGVTEFVLRSSPTITRYFKYVKTSAILGAAVLALNVFNVIDMTHNQDPEKHKIITYPHVRNFISMFLQAAQFQPTYHGHLQMVFKIAAVERGVITILDDIYFNDGFYMGYVPIFPFLFMMTHHYKQPQLSHIVVFGSIFYDMIYLPKVLEKTYGHAPEVSLPVRRATAFLLHAISCHWVSVNRPHYMFAVVLFEVFLFSTLDLIVPSYYPEILGQ